jgi:hypothetical protein
VGRGILGVDLCCWICNIFVESGVWVFLARYKRQEGIEDE